MKLKIQTKTEKENFLGLLLLGNFLATTICFILLMLQFFIFPQHFGIIWTFVVMFIISIAWWNLKFFRSHYKISNLWGWLKQHQ